MNDSVNADAIVVQSANEHASGHHLQLFNWRRERLRGGTIAALERVRGSLSW